MTPVSFAEEKMENVRYKKSNLRNTVYPILRKHVHARAYIIELSTD